MKRSTVCDIAEKWYKRLPFPKEFDLKFQELLEENRNLKECKTENYVTDENTENCGENLIMLLYFCEELEKKYIEKNIPAGILEDTLYDIVSWTLVYYNDTGLLGIRETGWLKRHLSFNIFRLGRLQFGLDKCAEDIPEINVKKDDVIVEVHIPSGAPLDYDMCCEAFKTAEEFYKKYFPEVDYKCFTCRSWLLSDMLKNMLNENSNILNFQKLFNIVSHFESDGILKFTFNQNATRENLKNYSPKSTFAQKIMEMVSDNKKFYSAMGYRCKCN